MSIQYLITNDKLDIWLGENVELFKRFQKSLNEKKFTVSDTNLTYRQASYINKNILKDERANKQGWRKFSLKELIYISLVQELRLFGLNDKQLMNLKKAFFTGKYKLLSDMAIAFTMKGIKIHIVLDNQLNIGCYNVVHFKYMFESQEKAYINLNLNDFVNEIWEGLGKMKVDYEGIDEIMGK